MADDTCTGCGRHVAVPHHAGCPTLGALARHERGDISDFAGQRAATFRHEGELFAVLDNGCYWAPLHWRGDRWVEVYSTDVGGDLLSTPELVAAYEKAVGRAELEGPVPRLP